MIRALRRLWYAWTHPRRTAELVRLRREKQAQWRKVTDDPEGLLAPWRRYLEGK